MFEIPKHVPYFHGVRPAEVIKLERMSCMSMAQALNLKSTCTNMKFSCLNFKKYSYSIEENSINKAVLERNGLVPLAL